MTVSSSIKTIQKIMRQDRGLNGDAQRIEQMAWMFFLKIMDDQDQQLELINSNYKPPLPEELRWKSWAQNPEGITGDELLDFVNGQLFPSLKEISIPKMMGERALIIKSVFEDALNYMKSGQLIRQVINKINEIDFNNLASRQHFGDIYEQILKDLQSAGNAGEYYTPRALTDFMVQMIDPKPGEVILDPACGTGGFLTSAISYMRNHYIKRVDDESLMQSSLRANEKMQLPHILATTNMLLHEIEAPTFIKHSNTLARPYTSYSSEERVDIVLTNPPFGGTEEPGIESNFPSHLQTRETADLFLALIVRLLRTGGRSAVVLPDGSLFGDGVKSRVRQQLLEECNLHTIIRLPNSVFKPYATVGTNLLFFEKGVPTEGIWYYEHRVPQGQKSYSKTKPMLLEHIQPIVEWWGGESREGRDTTELSWFVPIQVIKDRNYDLDLKNPSGVNIDQLDVEEMMEKYDSAVKDREEILKKLTVELSRLFKNG